MWRVNVLGVFWCMQEQIQIMKRQDSGHIVNIASIAGLHGIHNSGTYVATKHAVCRATFYTLSSNPPLTSALGCRYDPYRGA